ncbi:MAG: hypothetical protein AAGE03_12335 [Pseudomonadota bacterium]
MSAFKILAIPVAFLLAAPAFAETTEVTIHEASQMVGASVTTADDIPLGELIGVQRGPNGCAITIVKLHERLEVQTSPLQVVGLRVDENGKLHVTDASSDLERTMGLPF